MSSQTVVHNTFVVERSYPVTVERAYSAFADPALKRRWYADRDAHDVDTFEHDFRVEELSACSIGWAMTLPFPEPRSSTKARSRTSFRTSGL